MPYSSINSFEFTAVETEITFTAGYSGSKVNFTVKISAPATQFEHLDTEAQQFIDMIKAAGPYSDLRGVRRANVGREIVPTGDPFYWVGSDPEQAPTEPPIQVGYGYAVTRWVWNPYEEPIVDLGWFPSIALAEAAIDDHRVTDPDPEAPARVEWKVEGPLAEPTP